MEDHNKVTHDDVSSISSDDVETNSSTVKEEMEWQLSPSQVIQDEDSNNDRDNDLQTDGENGSSQVISKCNKPHTVCSENTGNEKEGHTVWVKEEIESSELPNQVDCIEHTSSEPSVEEDQLEDDSTECVKANIEENNFDCNQYLTLHYTQENNVKPRTLEALCNQYPNMKKLFMDERKQTREKNFSCHHCPYKATVKSNLLRHITIHTGQKPFSCDFCPYKSITKNDLVLHTRTHTGEKPFNCTQCPYKAKRRKELLNHVLTHTGEKPFACDQCSYKAIRRHDLVTHMLTHTGEKPYSCEHCSYKAIRRYDLSKHIRTHFGEKNVGKDITNRSPTQHSKELSRQRSQRYREKKRVDLLNNLDTARNRKKPSSPHSKELSRQRSQRYREKKRVDLLNNLDIDGDQSMIDVQSEVENGNEILNSELPGPSWLGVPFTQSTDIGSNENTKCYSHGISQNVDSNSDLHSNTQNIGNMQNN